MGAGVLLIAVPNASAVQDAPIDRDLAAFVLAYRDRMPRTENSGAYHWDEDSEDDVATMIAAFRRANRGTRPDRLRATAELREFGYNLEWVRDTVSDRRYLVASEQEPCARCWGLYILRYEGEPAEANVAVEVPHPFHDTFSEELGVELFRAVDAKMFAMAGTHRYANGREDPVADMARSYTSLFHKIHTNFTTEDTHVVQVHGFSARPDYPEAVLSNGTAEPGPAQEELAGLMNAAGISTDLFDGSNYPDLGATINPQGRHTNGKGGTFYHLETVYPVRSDAGRRLAVIAAFAGALHSD
ncbi:hypothetical protein D5S17_13640 [Pseudonocardiaceae bacterium YIM PH 21723]|nr:hypothetical protein D5S17_13640 [Pseudonocardiaceae bacterium YIM PH 21723]